MTKRQPPSPAAHPFRPVPVKPRRDGWTPERQRAFIEALAECGRVRAAAEAIGMTPQGAYWLRRHPDAESFAAAWDEALAQAAPPPPILPPMTLRGIMHVLAAAQQRADRAP